MRLSNLLVGASLAGALLTACTTDEIAIPRSELYAREFIKKFGVIDPNRDLSAATHSGINVVTTSPTDVKVYADINGKRYLFAEGRKISGTTPIKFDVPKSVKEVIVDAGGQKIKASLGSTVRVSGLSRAESIGDATDNDVADGPGVTFCNNSVTYYKTKPKIFLAQDIIDVVHKLPEETPNTNVEGIVADFYFQAEAGEQLTFYPLYWNTSSHHSLGIYWLDEENGFHWAEVGEKTAEWNYPVVTTVYNNYMQDLYQTRTGRLLECKNYNPETSTDEDFLPISGQQCSFSEVYSSYIPETSNAAFKAIGVTMKFHKPLKFGFFLKVSGGTDPYEADENGFVDISLYEQEHIFFSQAIRNQRFGKILTDGNYNLYKNEEITEIVDYDAQTIKYFNNNGVELTPPYAYQKIQFNNVGWNVTNNQSHGFGGLAQENFFKGENDYSRAAYVSLPVRDDAGNVIRKRTYFAFEDWSNGPIDLNDLVFIMDSEVQAYDENDDPIEEPEPDPDPDPEVYQWMIAAEDLAGTYDWDFNDAVFAVSATTIVDGEDNNSTKTEITVEPLAAGGTLPIYVMFNGTIADENGQDLGTGHFNIGPELHKWLGGHFRTPINVDSPVASAKGNPLTFTVNGQWSLTEEYKDKPQWQQNDVKGMGGFYVLVNPGNGLNQLQEDIIKFDPALLDDENHYHMVTPPTSFNKQDQVHISPEMLCMEANWCWPMEEVGIHTVYYNFEQWLRGEAAEWYSDPATWNPSKVVSRK